MSNKEEEKESFWDKYLAHFIIIIVHVLVIGWFVWGALYADLPEEPDCAYTDEGCPWDNRWGQ